MNNFINTINVEGVDYDIQTSVNPPLAYSGYTNSLHLNIGTGLDIYDGNLIADITHKFDHFNSIIIDPEYWSIDNKGCLLPSSTLQIGTDRNNLKPITTLILGSGLSLENDELKNIGGIPISTDAGSSISYINSLNIGQGLKYDSNELSVDSIQTEGGILICTEDGSFERAERVTGIKISNDFSFSTHNSLLSLNLSFESEEFTQDDTGHVTLKYDSETLSTSEKGLTLSTNMKGLGGVSDNKYGVRTVNPLYINDDNQISINIGTGLHLELGGLSIIYDATYFTINDIGELTLNNTVKEKLGLL